MYVETNEVTSHMKRRETGPIPVHGSSRNNSWLLEAWLLETSLLEVNQPPPLQREAP